MASGATQAASRGGVGKRRQGPLQASIGARVQAAVPTSTSPALRPLEELSAEWQRRKGRVPSGIAEEVNSRTTNGAREIHGGGGERQKQWRPSILRRTEGNNCFPSTPISGSDTGSSLLQMLRQQDVKYEREVILRRRPRPGTRPQGLALPTTLAIPSKIDSASWSSSPETCPSENTAELDTPSLSQAESDACEPEGNNCLLFVELRVEKASPDPFAGARDILTWGLDEDQDQELPAGIEKSRGFSKWFHPARRKSSSNSCSRAEAGMSTDAGSGGDDSSDDEDVKADRSVDVKLMQAELLSVGQSTIKDVVNTTEEVAS